MLNIRQEQGHRLEFGSNSPQVRMYSPDLQEEPTSSSLFAEYLHTVNRHRTLILIVALSCACIAALIHLRTQPVYKTRMSLNIQTLNTEFMNIRSVDTTLGAPTETLVQTQIKLLESESLLDRVKERLTLEPHPESTPQNDLLSQMEQSLHIAKPSSIPFEDLLDRTAKSVKIKPLGITQLVEVTCESWDAAFAARFCNTLTSEFQSADLESRGDQAKKTSDWLVRQAGDVRQKAQESEQKLIAATGGNGLMLSDQTNGVGEDGLRQLQGELVRAQASRMEKEAELATAQRSPGRGLGTDTPAYAANKVRLADLQNQIAAIVPPLTEANPKVIHLRSEIRQVEENLRSESQDSDARLLSEYSAAKHHEDLLSMAYRAREGHVSTNLQKSSEVEILRHEVQAEQQLYQTLLQRAKEAGFASALPASTVRIVDPAKAPRFPVYPQRVTTMAAGFVVGGLLGIVIAFLRERTALVMRLPGDSERFVRTAELGVIPSSGNIRTSQSSNSRPELKAKQTEGLTVVGMHPSLHSTGWNDDLSLVAEAYRNVTLSIMLAERVQHAKTYVVSSPSAGEGKTTVASNLAIALSKSRQRVLIIDGDLRKPSLHRIFSLPNQAGLRQVLKGDVPVNDVSLIALCQPTAFENLYVIPSGAGRDSTVELLHSPDLARLVGTLSSRFDVILVDTPPILHMADARILAGHANGTILVFRSGITTREDAVTARAMLDRDRIRVLGSILNDFNPKNSGKNNYYKSYTAYQHNSEAEEHRAVVHP